MVYVYLAEGFEETEAVVTIDFLRRAGLEVNTVGVDSRGVVGSHEMLLEADLLIERVSLSDTLEAIVLPGGSVGAKRLAVSEDVKKALMYAAEKGVLIAAICAAPAVLGQLGLLEGKKATCYPGLEDKLTGAKVVSNPVVVSDNIITGKSAGVTLEFAEAIVTALKGQKAADKVIAAMYGKNR